MINRAHLVTIGTEITSGEVVNSNAAWISKRLEDLGVRVLSHLSVRDQRDEILAALQSSGAAPVTVVTGGLGPTSDDITRNCVAEHAGCPLEFDEAIWRELETFYESRGLKLLEAHEQQCFFPRGSSRLKNPAGTALGFQLSVGGRQIYVLPGPPREMEAVWSLGCEPHLKKLLGPPKSHWERWTCLGLPESEVADRVDKAVAGSGLEVGYRAAIPYVKVKLFVENGNREHEAIVLRVHHALADHVVARGEDDLAVELLSTWPAKTLSVYDQVCDGYLSQRLFEALRILRSERRPVPEFEISVGGPFRSADLQVLRAGEGFSTVLGERSSKNILPYKWSLDSDRGKRSAAEWVLWDSVRALRASSRKVRAT